MYSIYRPPIDREIVGPVTLSPEWLDIAPNPTLKPSRTVQQIILDLGEPVSVKTQDAMVSLSDGSVVYVEVQLIDDHGNNYYFHPTSNPSPTEVGFHRAGGCYQKTGSTTLCDFGLTGHYDALELDGIALI